MGMPVDTDRDALVQVIVKKEVADRLKQAARREGLSRADVVRRILYRWDEREREERAEARSKRKAG
jgi:Ribbon-helix-helix protein, copG family